MIFLFFYIIMVSPLCMSIGKWKKPWKTKLLLNLSYCWTVSFIMHAYWKIILPMMETRKHASSFSKPFEVVAILIKKTKGTKKPSIWKKVLMATKRNLKSFMSSKLIISLIIFHIDSASSGSSDSLLSFWFLKWKENVIQFNSFILILI